MSRRDDPKGAGNPRSGAARPAAARKRVKRATTPPAAPEAAEAPLRRQCSAKSRTSGGRCKQPPIPGGFVCRYHGGAAPQTKQKAALRLAQLVDPAIATLGREMVKADKSADRQRAANSILDRAGIARGHSSEVETARALLFDRFREIRDRAAAGGGAPVLELDVIVDAEEVDE